PRTITSVTAACSVDAAGDLALASGVADGLDKRIPEPPPKPICDLGPDLGIQCRRRSPALARLGRLTWRRLPSSLRSSVQTPPGGLAAVVALTPRHRGLAAVVAHTPRHRGLAAVVA